ncbi:MAG TPA: hypothetical protein VJ952_00570 [Opitutales bacterium]|nr:hypothetical protein [Opitutales bacterium]
MTENNKTQAEAARAEKPGLFKKLFTKLDDKLQAKAKESSGSCCSPSDKKNGKCC